MIDARPFRLNRLPQEGYIAGICAGLARYVGIDVTIVRIAWGLGLVFFSVPVLLAYLVLWAVLPVPPAMPLGSPQEEALLRRIHLGPKRALKDVGLRLREAESRIAAMESAVLSKAYKLRRQFKDIDPR